MPFPDELSGRAAANASRLPARSAMRPQADAFTMSRRSALDPEMIREVLDVMANLSAEGMTSIVVTHEMGFCTSAPPTGIVFMESGEIIEEARRANSSSPAPSTSAAVASSTRSFN